MNDCVTVAESLRFGDVACEDSAGLGQEGAGSQGDSFGREFGFCHRGPEAEGCFRDRLIMLADFLCDFWTVLLDPALYEPVGMSIGLR